MKFGVNKKVLLYTAGCVWIFAGINILRIGIVTWLTDTHYWLFKIGEATIVFLLFFNLVFKRLFYKHSERISRKNGKHCPFSFFDVKGWIIMIFMIAFGITIRALHLLPNSQFSIFNSQAFRRSTQPPSCRSSACRQRSVPYGSYRLRR